MHFKSHVLNVLCVCRCVLKRSIHCMDLFSLIQYCIYQEFSPPTHWKDYSINLHSWSMHLFVLVVNSQVSWYKLRSSWELFAQCMCIRGSKEPQGKHGLFGCPCFFWLGSGLNDCRQLKIFHSRSLGTFTEE